jgi:hypothetical protein
MKKVFFVVLILIFAIPGKAQIFIGGFTVGTNITQVEGDEVNGYSKIGFNVGPLVMIPLDKKQRFFITMELLFSQKGAYQKNYSNDVSARPFNDTVLFDPSYQIDSSIYYKLRLDYVEVPIVFHYEDPYTGYAFGIGFSWARLVNYKEMVFGRRLYADLQSGRYYRNDWSFIVDVKIPLYRGLKFNFRYQYSMVPMGAERNFYESYNTPPFTRKPYNNVLTFRLLYTFNDKYTYNNQRDRSGKLIGPRWVRTK